VVYLRAALSPPEPHRRLAGVGSLRNASLDWREWWTALDCDGRLYLSAGYRFVNRIGYVRCAIPWSDADQFRHYRYA